MKSTYAGALSLDAAQVVVNELTLLGSRCGPFPPALALLERKAVDAAPLIHARYGFDHALDALDHARRPEALKVLLEMT
jgi:threonine dehydrogenase-like Zn-dependent dehydrogenase